MNQACELKFSAHFLRKIKKLLEKNPSLTEKLQKCLIALRHDPFYPGLHSHKIESQLYGHAYSSRFTDDLRIIWQMEEDAHHFLDLIDVGGHSGAEKVYD